MQTGVAGAEHVGLAEAQQQGGRGQHSDRQHQAAADALEYRENGISGTRGSWQTVSCHGGHGDPPLCLRVWGFVMGVAGRSRGTQSW